MSVYRGHDLILVRDDRLHEDQATDNGQLTCY
jgi:hypothetical protein